jgi:succinate-semialdehyde dehydrogenase / glutarate-semialdehyde dehydrogenase
VNAPATSGIPVRNPRTGLIDFTLQAADATAVAAEAARLRSAQPAWRAMGVEARAAALLEFRDALTRHEAAMQAALHADTGRAIETQSELRGVRDTLTRWCNQAPELLAQGSAPRNIAIPGFTTRRVWAPYPLVGVISPWNFPFLLSFIDAIPALLAGCATLIKPSEVTPRFVGPLRAALAEVPAVAAVVGVVEGDGSTGAALIEVVDQVCFTGSVPTGRKVAEAAARRFIPAQLELGGKDPAIVTADTDLPRAAAAIAWGGLANAGQSCLSIERVYVERAAYEPFLAALAAQVGVLRLNLADIASGEIGPVISAKQVEIVRHHLDDARAKGARFITGGHLVEQGGVWCEPTIIADATPEMLVIAEESFAPLLAVAPFDTDAEAVALANATPYGLSAAVFCNDTARCEAIASQLEAGGISLNDAALTGLIHEGEKQAFKFSGLGGSRMGTPSIFRFLRAQAHLRNTGGQWNPWWFPRPESGKA